MAFSDKIQDELEARLQSAFVAMKKRGEYGATAKEIAAEVLGVERADNRQIRQFGMMIKAMRLRNMTYALPKEREKAETRWVAIDKSQWRYVEDANQSEKLATFGHRRPTEADKEQREWYLGVMREVKERREFRRMIESRYKK
jgi:hypothetical protein